MRGCEYQKGDKVKIVSPALDTPGTVAMVKKTHEAGYIIRLPTGQTEFVLPDEIKSIDEV